MVTCAVWQGWGGGGGGEKRSTRGCGDLVAKHGTYPHPSPRRRQRDKPAPRPPPLRPAATHASPSVRSGATNCVYFLITTAPLSLTARCPPGSGRESERDGGWGREAAAGRRSGVWRGGAGGAAASAPRRAVAEAEPGGGSTAAAEAPARRETPPSGPSWQRRGSVDPKGIPPRSIRPLPSPSPKTPPTTAARPPRRGCRPPLSAPLAPSGRGGPAVPLRPAAPGRAPPARSASGGAAPRWGRTAGAGGGS